MTKRRAGQMERKPPDLVALPPGFRSVRAATLPFDRETRKAFRKQRRSRSGKVRYRLGKEGG